MNWMRQLRARTIWAPEAIPPEDARVAALLRRALPTFDVILALFGMAAFFYGAPLFSSVLLGSVSVLFGIAVAITATTALIGLVFRKTRLELVSKIALMSVSIIYPVFLTIGTFDAVRAAVAVLCFLPIPILLWRVGDMGREKGKKQSIEKGPEL